MKDIKGMKVVLVTVAVQMVESADVDDVVFEMDYKFDHEAIHDAEVMGVKMENEY